MRAPSAARRSGVHRARIVSEKALRFSGSERKTWYPACIAATEPGTTSEEPRRGLFSLKRTLASARRSVVQNSALNLARRSGVHVCRVRSAIAALSSGFAILALARLLNLARCSGVIARRMEADFLAAASGVCALRIRAAKASGAAATRALAIRDIFSRVDGCVFADPSPPSVKFVNGHSHIRPNAIHHRSSLLTEIAVEYCNTAISNLSPRDVSSESHALVKSLSLLNEGRRRFSGRRIPVADSPTYLTSDVRGSTSP
jgi:hypothetical protein